MESVPRKQMKRNYFFASHELSPPSTSPLEQQGALYDTEEYLEKAYAEYIMQKAVRFLHDTGGNLMKQHFRWKRWHWAALIAVILVVVGIVLIHVIPFSPQLLLFRSTSCSEVTAIQVTISPDTAAPFFLLRGRCGRYF